MNSIFDYIKKYNYLIIPFSIFILTFFLYVHNLSRFIYGGDVGDILLAVGVRGVAHPSGYPLYTLLGIIFSLLPIDQPLAYKVGLVSALFASLSVVILYLICLRLTKNKYISLISSLTLAFSYIFWLYAEVAEVFSLAGFFILILFYLTLLFYEKKANIYLYLLAFLAGLSLSHHLIILILFPSLFFLIIRSKWKIILDFRLLFTCFFLFLLGLLPYLYIPIAASHYPLYSWDNAINLNNFIRLITRADYGWGNAVMEKELIKSSINMRFWAVIKYYVDLYHIATIFVLAFSLFGIANLLLKKKFTILFCLLISYILFGPFFIFYNSSGPIIYPYTTGVIERFYIFSLIFIMIFFSLACSLVLDSMEKILKSKRISKNRINIYKFILYLVFLIIPFYLLIINFKTTDLSNVSIGEEMGKDYLINLPKDSFLFISGDTATQNIWYVQHILGFRKDVTVINPQLPYLNMRFVKKIYPKFINPKKPFLDLKFKINKVILDNYGKRFAFAGYGAVSLKEKEIEWIPRGLAR